MHLVINNFGYAEALHIVNIQLIEKIFSHYSFLVSRSYCQTNE